MSGRDHRHGVEEIGVVDRRKWLVDRSEPAPNLTVHLLRPDSADQEHADGAECEEADSGGDLSDQRLGHASDRLSDDPAPFGAHSTVAACVRPTTATANPIPLPMWRGQGRASAGTEATPRDKAGDYRHDIGGATDCPRE